MERTTIALIALCLVLILAQFFMMRDGFLDVNAVVSYCVDTSGNTLPCGSSGKCINTFGNFDTCSTTAVINNCKDSSGNYIMCGSSGKCIDQSNNIIPCLGVKPPGGGRGWNKWGDQDLEWSQEEDEDQDLDYSQAYYSKPPSAMGGQGGNYNAQINALRNDIRKTIKKEVANSCSSSSDSCGDTNESSCREDFSPAEAQGAQFLKEVYGQNPNAYIKKDSIPCYGCSLPE